MNIEKHISTISTFSIPVEPEDDIQFGFLNVTAQTVRSGKLGGPVVLYIRVHEKIETFDSAHESARYSRPQLLVVLGILSFVSGRDFTIYDAIASSSSTTVGSVFLKRQKRAAIFTVVITRWI